MEYEFATGKKYGGKLIKGLLVEVKFWNEIVDGIDCVKRKC